MTPEEVRRLVPGQLSPDEVVTLVDWYANLRRALDAFPRQDLKDVEPPLRSTPGPDKQV